MPSESFFLRPARPPKSVLLILFTRRLIGRRFDDPTVKKDIESWPFKVIEEGTTPKIEVDYLGEKKSFSAQEISSMVLLKVRTVRNLGTHRYVSNTRHR